MHLPELLSARRALKFAHLASIGRTRVSPGPKARQKVATPVRRCEKIGVLVTIECRALRPSVYASPRTSVGPSGLEICAFGKHWTYACITRAKGPAESSHA